MNIQPIRLSSDLRFRDVKTGKIYKFLGSSTKDRFAMFDVDTRKKVLLPRDEVCDLEQYERFRDRNAYIPRRTVENFLRKTAPGGSQGR